MNSTIRKKISEGIVLESSILSQAGMQNEIDIEIQEGAIFILPVVKEEDWKVLASIGNDAVEGNLKNPSKNHDRYLYGDSK
ncbi:MAG TPA: hypothetical protein VJ954_09145 [Ignavibacteriaceae bacterium]|nr:hypothetical protein [Ignavibacteriaceae bacterium]